MTKNNVNLNDVLDQSYEVPKLKFDGAWTKVTHFLLPGLHISMNSSDFREYFVNAFLNDEEITHIFRNPVFVLWKTKQFDARWRGIDKILQSSPRCVYNYYVGKRDDYHLIMYLYEYPVAYKADYQRFLDGEYSKFSDNFKKLFKYTIINTNGETVENPIYGAVYKTNSLKTKVERMLGDEVIIGEDSEYWQKWSKDREIFRKKT